jgi:hypothetical protein
MYIHAYTESAHIGLHGKCLFSYTESACFRNLDYTVRKVHVFSCMEMHVLGKRIVVRKVHVLGKRIVVRKVHDLGKRIVVRKVPVCE